MTPEFCEQLAVYSDCSASHYMVTWLMLFIVVCCHISCSSLICFLVFFQFYYSLFDLFSFFTFVPKFFLNVKSE